MHPVWTAGLAREGSCEATTLRNSSPAHQCRGARTSASMRYHIDIILTRSIDAAPSPPTPAPERVASPSTPSPACPRDPAGIGHGRCHLAEPMDGRSGIDVLPCAVGGGRGPATLRGRCRPGCRFLPADRKAPGLLQRMPQDELDLPVDAAQLVARPTLQRDDDLRIRAQQEWSTYSHTGYLCRALVLTAGRVARPPDCTASRLLAMAALRSSLSSTIWLGQVLERHIHHADRPAQDPGSRRGAFIHAIRCAYIACTRNMKHKDKD